MQTSMKSKFSNKKKKYEKKGRQTVEYVLKIASYFINKLQKRKETKKNQKIYSQNEGENEKKNKTKKLPSTKETIHTYI